MFKKILALEIIICVAIYRLIIILKPICISTAARH